MPDQALVDDPKKVLQTITAFARGGKGDGHALPRLAKGLTFDYRIQVRDLLPALAQRISGDEAMQLGEIIGESLDVTLKLALKARPALATEQLQRHLRSLSADDLAALGDDDAVFAEVRKRMPGPMARELPRLADFPRALHGKPRLVKWFLEGDPTVSALNLATSGSPELARSLDELHAWGWLDHLHVAQNFFLAPGLEALRGTTGDASVKAKIGHLLGSFKSDQYGMADVSAASHDLHDNIVNHGDTSALLTASGISRSVDAADKEGVERRLRGEPASVVLEFAFVTSFELPRAIPLLANARGATADQMQLLVTSHNTEERIAALGNDKLRAQVRKVLGMRTPLVHLFPDLTEREDVHAALYKDEALRQWAYQEKNPETYLWLAAGSRHAKEACKLVQREVGYGWVTQLSPLAPNVELRRFALNCGDDKMTAYVHAHLFGDRTFKIDPSENTISPLPGDVYGQRADHRLASAAGAENADPKLVLARLGDLDPAQRAAALANAAEMKTIFGALAGDDAVRAVFLLGPTLPQLFTLPLRDAPGVLDYLRTRPPAEEPQALARPSLLPHV
ncbi:MAG TPA: hypothetical protein VFP84_02450, partial [Kofleriaceae bacterium]|nr:hypothetical protein [Kofleriaceae bacterium]